MQAATVANKTISNTDMVNIQISIIGYNYLILEVLGRFQNLVEYLNDEMLAIFDEINLSRYTRK